MLSVFYSFCRGTSYESYTTKRQHVCHVFALKCVVLLTGVLSLAVLAVGAQAVILDTFTRGNHYDPVATEVGMSGTSVDKFLYGKATMYAGASNFSSGGITGEKLHMNRAASNGHQVILLDSNFPNLTMSTTINWDFDQSEGPYLSVKDGHGFWLRKPAATSAQNNANNNGGVSVFSLASGALFIRENVAGTEVLLYADNPFKTISSPGNLYHMGTFSNGGPLPAQWNGLPLDVDEDGALERDEPYRFGVRLDGTSLEVDLNGAADGTSLTLSGDGTASPTGNNLVSFIRWDLSHSHSAAVFHDDFDITVIPEPSSIVLLSIGLLSLVFCRRRRRT